MTAEELNSVLVQHGIDPDHTSGAQGWTVEVRKVDAAAAEAIVKADPRLTIEDGVVQIRWSDWYSMESSEESVTVLSMRDRAIAAAIASGKIRASFRRWRSAKYLEVHGVERDAIEIERSCAWNGYILVMDGEVVK